MKKPGLVVFLCFTLSVGFAGVDDSQKAFEEQPPECPSFSATASSAADSSDAAFAVDNNFTTRWVSAGGGEQRLKIDLQRLRHVNGLQLYWHMACASEYKVHTSPDETQWDMVHHAQNAQPGAHFFDFSGRPARYIKIECIAPFSTPAYSLHEVIVETDDECTPKADWVLVWSDEFDGSRIDPANWSHQIGGHGWGNNELQYYTDSPANSYLEDGKLVIRVSRETEPVGGRNYTSARIRSEGKRSFVYGKLEARIKIPSGMGIWPAFWMMPENTGDYDRGWPACGEIDIMEAINITTSIHGTLHFGSRTPNRAHHKSGGRYTGPAGERVLFSDDFHIYSIVWEPDRIRWYCDGVLYSTKTADQWWTSYSSDPKAPFDKPFHFIFNVAVGGNWPGFEIDDSQFPHSMVIDWVRVYQKPY